MSRKFIENIVSVLSLCISVIAIIFSCQANNIAKHQANPKVIVTSINQESGGIAYYPLSGKSNANCSLSVRLANIGGADCSIIGYTINILYASKNIQLKSESSNIQNEAVSLNNITNITNLFFKDYQSMRDFRFYKKNDNIFQEDNTEFMKIPFKVEAGSAFDIYSNLQYEFVKLLPTKEKMLIKEHYKHNIPLEIYYIFRAANGDEITSPRILCNDFHTQQQRALE